MAVPLGWEIILSYASIALTLLATVMVTIELMGIMRLQLAHGDYSSAASQALFIWIVAFLVYGALVYQFTRCMYLRRRGQHRPASRQDLESLYDGQAPMLTILVPSYKEDARVVMLTIISAALQDYPNRRVVLLIDDPPNPANATDAAQLQAARELPDQIRRLLAEPAQQLRDARDAYLARCKRSSVDTAQELAKLAALYDGAANWFTIQAQNFPVSTHVDRFFLEKLFLSQRNRLAGRALALRQLSESRHYASDSCAKRQLLREYNRLALLFSVEITSFERKRYTNLSHEPNKAMNLNSYIGLLGKYFKERRADGALYLETVSEEQADFHVPDADYLITLDADSLLAADYTLRLVYFAEQPGNERIAVAQTPYSAFHGAPGVVERIAGATTDIQYIIHQGFSGYNATYWVGANALLRMSALRDIAVVDQERGFSVTRFIQDRTVIEDTESSIDLVRRGWRLYNYPERLAYSATPPDFGSLIIQRRRWANGGLLILPKLLHYLSGGSATRAKLAEGLMRIHYLVSITAVNVGLMVMLAVPLEVSIRSLWLPLTALPYFLLYARDLRLVGYQTTDMFRVYALNLLLIPVNLAGVAKSLQQAWTKKKSPFGRTPKVRDRTAAPTCYIVAEFTLVAHWQLSAVFDTLSGYWFHAFFATVNACILLYAILIFIGLEESKEDLWLGILRRLRAVADKRSALVTVLGIRKPTTIEAPTMFKVGASSSLKSSIAALLARGSEGIGST